MIIVIVTAHATLKRETSDVEAAIARRVGEETVLAHSKVRLLQEANSILMEQKTMHEEHLNEAQEQLAAQVSFICHYYCTTEYLTNLMIFYVYNDFVCFT